MRRVRDRALVARRFTSHRGWLIRATLTGSASCWEHLSASRLRPAKLCENLARFVFPLGVAGFTVGACRAVAGVQVLQKRSKRLDNLSCSLRGRLASLIDVMTCCSFATDM